MSKPVAWSYSRLTNFEQCPKKYWHLTVAKDIKEAESEPMRYGKEVHKAIEQRISEGTKFPLHLTHLEKLVAPFASAKGTILVEQQLALNDSLQPTGWFDDDVFCRATLDYAAINGDRALLIDWKTGRISDDFTQQKLVAAVFFVFHPEVETAELAYGWLKSKQFTRDTLRREDVKHVWSGMLRRVKKFQHAYRNDEFPARPSGLCKRHCPVTSCPYHGD